MHTIPDNTTRVQRFRELKATLRTARTRLLVGIDIAKATHVAQVRLAHTRVLAPTLAVPNTAAGFATFWARLQAHATAAGVREIVCAVEPTGTYHQALATFLEQQGATVVLVSNHVAQLNRRTLDGTWGKSDPKDAHNLCDLLEQGKVLFYSLPEEPLADLRRLVRLLRRARAELSACKARFTVSLLPQFGPMGDALAPTVAAQVPAPLQRFLPKGARVGAVPAPGPAIPPGLAFELTDLTARVRALAARISAIETELLRVANPLPAFALLQTIPGIGPTVGAILVAEIGDIGWYLKFSQLRKLAGLDIISVQTGQWSSRGRISKAGRALLRWALYQAAIGACRNPAWHARREALIAKRHGDRHAFFKANVELGAKLLRLVWGVWRSGRAYDPAWNAAAPRARGDTQTRVRRRAALAAPPTRSPRRRRPAEAVQGPAARPAPGGRRPRVVRRAALAAPPTRSPILLRP
jgi:transposase